MVFELLKVIKQVLHDATHYSPVRYITLELELRSVLFLSQIMIYVSEKIKFIRVKV